MSANRWFWAAFIVLDGASILAALHFNVAVWATVHGWLLGIATVCFYEDIG